MKNGLIFGQLKLLIQKVFGGQPPTAHLNITPVYSPRSPLGPGGPSNPGGP